MRILLVDDEPDILLLLQTMLSVSSWEVVGKATSGEEALRIAGEIDPDVAIVDYMMPGMQGFEVAAGLKELSPDCDVVIFSAYNVEEQAAANPSVDRFLPKGDIGLLDGVLDTIAGAKGFSR
jgi:YesN/AraC family two-component response regulator